MTGSARARAASTPHWGERAAVWSTWTVLFSGVWCLVMIPLDVVAPSAARAGERLFGLVNIPVAPSLFTAVVLSALGSALAARKRAGLLFVAVVFQGGWLVIAALVTVLRFGSGGRAPKVLLDTPFEVSSFVVEVGFAIFALWVAWRLRSTFPARLTPGSIRRALINLSAGIAISASAGIVLTEIFPHTLRGQRRMVVWPVRAALGLVPAADSPFYNGSGHRWVAVVISLMSTLALLRAGYVLVRSARLTRHLDPADELRVRDLLARFGEPDSLGYFATRRDKAVVFAPDGRAAIAYRVEVGVMLASGDPIGDPTAWPAAITAWMAQARTYGWLPAVLSATERGAAAYRAAGLRVLNMGDEAILDVRSFHLNSPAMRPVRHAVTRVRRSAYSVEVRRHGDVPAREMSEIRSFAASWRVGEPERGFSMALGRLGDAADRRCVMVTARDRDGHLKSVLSLVPWGSGGLSLDLMRRDPTAENGVVEFMICGLVDASRRLGVWRVSLNFAMFREVFSGRERIGSGPVVRATGAVLSVASRWWQLESLYRSNMKYGPDWCPRYICFGDAFSLNRMMVASGIAEGFLPRIGFGSRELTQLPATEDFADAVLKQEVEAASSDVARRIPRLTRLRHRKVDAMRATGQSPYPVVVPRTDSIDVVRRRHGVILPSTSTGDVVSITGRVIALREHGRLVFAVVRESLVDMQIMIAEDVVGATAFAQWKEIVDLGDHVSCTGEVMTTRTGELSVAASSWMLASKCLHPFPRPNRSQLSDASRVRHRHLALLADPKELQALAARSKVLSTLRRVLDDEGFMEVETPMLHTVQGGAIARPFTTHSNAHDTDLYLRIAPELYLKRLCVGGLERVYELNRNFRNEGADRTHNPEFTALEVYQAHADYIDMQVLARQLVQACAVAVNGRAVAIVQPHGGAPESVDLAGPWAVVPVHRAVADAVGAPIDVDTDVDDLRTVCARHRIDVPFDATAGELVHSLYEHLVEPATRAPTFYTDFPVEVSPLARRHRDDPRLAERWDLVAFGMELGTAYSELTDPIDQRARLVRQARKASAGDPEAMQLDEDFLSALEFALPPTGGLGMGVDRLLMLVTGGNIRSTLAFPFVRPMRSSPLGDPGDGSFEGA